MRRHAKVDAPRLTRISVLLLLLAFVLRCAHLDEPVAGEPERSDPTARTSALPSVLPALPDEPLERAHGEVPLPPFEDAEELSRPPPDAIDEGSTIVAGMVVVQPLDRQGTIHAAGSLTDVNGGVRLVLDVDAPAGRYAFQIARRLGGCAEVLTAERAGAPVLEPLGEVAIGRDRRVRFEHLFGADETPAGMRSLDGRAVTVRDADERRRTSCGVIEVWEGRPWEWVSQGSSE